MPHIGWGAHDVGLVAWHLSIGASIMFVMFVRLLYRLHVKTPLPAELPLWERAFANIVHWMLYLLVFAMAILGWSAASAHGWRVRLFGLFVLPTLARKGAHWGFAAGDIHDVLVYVLLGFIVVHVFGAFFHYIIKQDRVLNRMLRLRKS